MYKIQPTEQVYGSTEKPWRRIDGSIIACTEKLKVMRENFVELRLASLAVLEDAVLMGCDEKQVKEALIHLVQSLSTDY